MVDYARMLRHAVDYEGGLERLGARAMNDIANECPMSMIGMESPVDSSVKFSAPRHRIASQQAGPGLELLTPAGDRER